MVMNKKEIWDKKAENFPRYDNSGDSESARLLDVLKRLGGIWSGRNVLDLGAGSGRYSLELAKEAKRVVAIDISSEMIKILNADAMEHGFKNVDGVCSDWDDVDLGSLGVEFDVIFASMTPALNNKKALIKAIDSAKNQFLYIGWGHYRKSKILEDIFERHNIKLELPNGAPITEVWLKELGIGYKAEYMPKVNPHKSNFKEALKSISWHIEIHQSTPNIEIIEDYLRDRKSVV